MVLEIRDNLSTEELEDIMNLSPAYLQQREEWKQEGTLEGQLSLIASHGKISSILGRT
jgi:hypothetical protein